MYIVTSKPKRISVYSGLLHMVYLQKLGLMFAGSPLVAESSNTGHVTIAARTGIRRVDEHCPRSRG
jgi:hypothetical protein